MNKMMMMMGAAKKMGATIYQGLTTLGQPDAVWISEAADTNGPMRMTMTGMEDAHAETLVAVSCEDAMKWMKSAPPRPPNLSTRSVDEGEARPRPTRDKQLRLSRRLPPKRGLRRMSLISEKTKGTLSGLEFRVLSKEISSALAGTYVSNIYSIGESQLLRMRRSGGAGGESTEVSLVISPRLGAWMTERPARVETTEFTTALRSHLLRAKLASVTQFDLDRVLTLEFEGKGDDRFNLVLELMPPGNLLLTGPDGKLVLLLRDVKTESRWLVKGHPYTPPVQRRASLETLTRDDLKSALAKEKTLGSALGRGLSIPRRYVDEILARLSLAQGGSTDIPEAEVDRMMSTVRDMLATIEDHPFPCLVRTEEGSVDVMVVKPAAREVVDASRTLSPLLDRLLFSTLLTAEEEAASRAEEESKGGAHKRRALELQATIAGLESKRASLTNLSTELRRLAQLVRGASDAGQALEVARGAKVLPGDLLSSLDELAEKGQASISSAIFDRAKTTERDVRDIDDAIRKLRPKLKKETGKQETARVKAIPISRSKKEWYEKFRWFFTTPGKLAIGGRDAQSNTTLIRRHLQDGDTVYHADLFGSPFFILKGGKEQAEEEVREVAKATVTFSSAWKTGLGAADAYWVAPEQVSAAGPSGEYLAHGSFAINGKKNFVTKNTVEVAVGIDDGGRIVSGPEEAIMKVARGHVTLVPSREKPSDTAKRVLHELGPYADPGVSISLDEVMRMLPAGGGKIIRRRADKKSS
jgi:predicted ribosome quality control (RQC) complex YloA/Tae2 family protein